VAPQIALKQAQEILKEPFLKLGPLNLTGEEDTREYGIRPAGSPDEAIDHAARRYAPAQVGRVVAGQAFLVFSQHHLYGRKQAILIIFSNASTGLLLTRGPAFGSCAPDSFFSRYLFSGAQEPFHILQQSFDSAVAYPAPGVRTAHPSCSVGLPVHIISGDRKCSQRPVAKVLQDCCLFRGLGAGSDGSPCHAGSHSSRYLLSESQKHLTFFNKRMSASRRKHDPLSTTGEFS
jgi:hypothetical protein